MPLRGIKSNAGAETSRIGGLGNWVQALYKVVVDFNCGVFLSCGSGSHGNAYVEPALLALVDADPIVTHYPRLTKRCHTLRNELWDVQDDIEAWFPAHRQRQVKA